MSSAKPICEEHGPKTYFEKFRAWRCAPCLARKQNARNTAKRKPKRFYKVIAHVCPTHGEKRRHHKGAWVCRKTFLFPRPKFDHKVWYENGGREKINANTKRYRKENPGIRKRENALRRGAKRGYWVTKRDQRRLSARQNGLCYYCRVRPPTDLEHIIPVSRGGVHSIGNLVLACGPCNYSKGAKLLIEWPQRPLLL